MHRIFLPSGIGPSHTGERLLIDGEEAEHALRVKRLGEGDELEILDGRGSVARGRIERTQAGRKAWALEVRILAVAAAAHVRPRVEVWSATPKGPRVDELVEGLSQVGAAAWRPLATERGVVSPRETKLERLERVAWESAKQCGRAWVLEVGSGAGLGEALGKGGGDGGGLGEALGKGGGDGGGLVVADAAGGPYEASGAETVRVLVGPEGGWSEAERRRMLEAGAQMARFAPHVMRIETAAVVAAAVVLDAEGRRALGEAAESGDGEGGEDASMAAG